MSDNKENRKQFYMVKNVRVAFPNVLTPGDKGYGAQLLFDKEDAREDKIRAAIRADIDMRIKEDLELKKLPADKICLRDGDESGYETMEGYWKLSANSKGKVVVVAGNGKDIIVDEEDNRIYSGCRVNAKISLWTQDNKHGKRVNCNLVSIQFAGDDEAFEGGHVSRDVAVEGFGQIDEEDDDFLG